MSTYDVYGHAFAIVDKMTGAQLRAYPFAYVKDERIFETIAVDKFCYGGGCSEFQNGEDDLAECRAGGDGLYSTHCERYWEVTEMLRGLVLADMIAREAVGDE